MNRWRQLKTEKGFTLIELMAVLAILAIIVAIAVPAVGSILAKSAASAEKSSIELMERAGEMAHLDGLDFETAGTPTERYAIPTLVSEGYLKLETDSPFHDVANYVVKQSNGTFLYNDEELVEEEPPIPDGYVLAGDSDFTFKPHVDAPNTYGGRKGYYAYTGTDTHVVIPETIQGHTLRDYYLMFNNSTVEGVISDNDAITDMRRMFFGSSSTTLDLSHFNTANVANMSYMFYSSKATMLDLTGFDTSNVTNMNYMFYFSEATTLDLTSFDTSNVTTMSAMFHDSQATTLDLSSFNTANVTDMSYMFQLSKATTLDLSSFNTYNARNMYAMFTSTQATTLDLSSFDTANVTNMNLMFLASKATTGYVRTQADANRLTGNNTSKPAGLRFIVK